MAEQYGAFAGFDHEPSAEEAGRAIQDLIRELDASAGAGKRKVDIIIKPCVEPGSWTVAVKYTMREYMPVDEDVFCGCRTD